MTSSSDNDSFEATARWDGERWAVSVPNHGGRTNTFAETLAEVVPNAAVVLGVLNRGHPASIEPRIDVQPYLEPDIAERFKTAPDPFDAAAVLREAGLCEEDIRDLVMARLPAAIAPGGSAGRPVDPWEGGR